MRKPTKKGIRVWKSNWPCRDGLWWLCNRSCELYRLAEGRFWRLRRQPWTRNGALRPTWLGLRRGGLRGAEKSKW